MNNIQNKRKLLQNLGTMALGLPQLLVIRGGTNTGGESEGGESPPPPPPTATTKLYPGTPMPLNP